MRQGIRTHTVGYLIYGHCNEKPTSPLFKPKNFVVISVIRLNHIHYPFDGLLNFTTKEFKHFVHQLIVKEKSYCNEVKSIIIPFQCART